ncbi:MAG: IPTL-CTERM sorting domain-containing protein, partial [Holophagales bacterium]|nr:IPTL-CTERM sorting domain-containing protein [Holophagales bacterium]
MRRFAWLMICFGACLSVAPAWAQSSIVLLDVDGDPATGCTVPTADGPFDGVEQRLESQLGPGMVTAVERSECLDPVAGTFGPAIGVAEVSPPWGIGSATGTAGSDVVEPAFPLSALPGQPSVIRLGFLIEDGLGGEDALLTLDGAPSGSPIEIELLTPLEIPTTSSVGLALLALLLGAWGAWLLRARRGPGMALLAVASLALTPLTVEAVGIILLDGDPSDWAGATDVSAADLLGDGAPGTDVVAAFAAADPSGSLLSLRIDVFPDAMPMAIDDTAAVNEDAPPSAIDVLGNDVDPDGGPISITGVTQPANGTVAITGGGSGLTYAPSADFCTDP